MKSVLTRLCQQADKLTYRPHLSYIRPGQFEYIKPGWSCQFEYRDDARMNGTIRSIVHGYYSKEAAYEAAERCWREIEQERVERRRHFPTIA